MYHVLNGLCLSSLIIQSERITGRVLDQLIFLVHCTFIVLVNWCVLILLDSDVPVGQ